MVRRILAGLTLSACLAAAGCGGPANSATPERPPDLVLFDRPITRTVTDYEVFPGRTEAVMSVEIRARVSGYLNQVYFQDGQEVEKDSVLFQIDPRPFQADLDRADAAHKQAIAHAQRLTNEFQRAKVLYDRGLSISREEYDRYAFDRAEAEAALGTAKADYDLAKLNLEFTRVTAPISGRLGRRLVDPGNLVKADETSLTTIVSQDPIYVYFDVHEQAMLKIRRMLREGNIKAKSEREVPVQIGLSDELENKHEGMVDFTDNRVDPDTGTLRFRAKLENPNGLFTPGLFVRVKLPIGDPHPALMVREEALVSDQGQKRVYVIRREMKDGEPAFFENEDGEPILGRDGEPIPKYVHAMVDVGEIGVLEDGHREVSQGIKPDDLIVVSGLQRLRKDAPVTARQYEPDVVASSDEVADQSAETQTATVDQTAGEEASPPSTPADEDKTEDEAGPKDAS